jgi:small basic protein (TIGR04137 family)
LALSASRFATIAIWTVISEEFGMTIDKSLKVRRGVGGARNVMTRAERLTKLKEQERWKEGDKVLGLPKVRVLKISMKKKKKAKAEEGDAAATPADGDAKKGGTAPAAKAAAPAAKAAAKPAAKK